MLISRTKVGSTVALTIVETWSPGSVAVMLLMVVVVLLVQLLPISEAWCSCQEVAAVSASAGVVV